MNESEKSRLDKMEEKLVHVEQKVGAVEGKVDRILVALIGDELTMKEGMVIEVQKLKERLVKLENWRNKLVYGALGAGIVLGFSFNKLLDLILKLMK